MELKIDQYLHDLLYSHNCVIIPGFGGFVGNYQSAAIHPAQHIFSAPRKQVAFNKNLTINDGLLAHYIVQKELITYPEAIELIDKDVFKMKHLLSCGERVNLKEIGFLKLDVEKNIQFSPAQLTNFELGSFGLYSFQSSAIKRGQYENASDNKFVDRPAVKTKVGFKKFRRLVLPAILLPVAVALFFSPYTQPIKNRLQVQTSGFFGSEEKALYQSVEHAFNLKQAELPELKVIAPVETTLAEEATNIATSNTSISEATASSAVETNNYTLVAGCFSLPENAEKQIQLLKSKNLSASIIGKTNSGLIRVGIGNYATAEAASEDMKALKEQQIEVWVLKN